METHWCQREKHLIFPRVSRAETEPSLRTDTKPLFYRCWVNGRGQCREEAWPQLAQWGELMVSESFWAGLFELQGNMCCSHFWKCPNLFLYLLNSYSSFNTQGKALLLSEASPNHHTLPTGIFCTLGFWRALFIPTFISTFSYCVLITH